jgi:hypothetical protein
MANNTPPDQPSEEVLQLALIEAHKKYERVNNDYNQNSTKLFTLLATELAILTFLFASDGGFLPEKLYGIIFYAIGVALVILAVAALFWGTLSNDWEEPAELKELQTLRYDSKAAFLEYLKDDYLVAYQFCLEQYTKRRKLLDWSIFLFVGGVTILMILKFGG